MVAQTLTQELRAMAEEGAKMHRHGTPEHTICRGLLAALTDIERLRATLAASCDEERSQLWEANSGGGCWRAIDAEGKIERLCAALTACQEDAERMRMWGGMGWVWHSHYAATIHERCERSLGPNVAIKRGPTA